MYVTQPQRVLPRWNEWAPLASQQFRLRNLVQIQGINVGREDLEGRICGTQYSSSGFLFESYYYTLHLTALSAPFYTSEKIQSDCPKWREIDSDTWSRDKVFGGTEALVLRVWCHNSEQSDDEVITVIGIHLSGLVLVGQQLSSNMPIMRPNTIIFLMSGGFYATPCCFADQPKRRFTSISAPKEDVRGSYTIGMLNKLQTVQKSIHQKTVSAEAIRQKIAMGDYLTQSNRGSAMLRRILSKAKPKANPLDVVKVKEGVEMARFRVQILKEEKSRLLTNTRVLRERVDHLSDGNQILESRTMEKYRLLLREVQAHREWLIGYVDRRESQLHARALLNLRMKQLIYGLCCIYPVENIGNNRFTICGVHLPDSENFGNHDDLKISVALGFVAHCVQMISVFLQVPLRYPVVHVGSRSRIIDDIADKIPDTEREFPLFCKGKDRLQFNYAVYLLNKNIAQLRCLCGLYTYDLRCTLANMSSLLRLGGPDSRNDVSFRSHSSSTLDLASSSYSATPAAVDMNVLQRVNITPCESSSPEAVPSVSISKETKRYLAQPDRTKTTIPCQNLASNFSYSLDKGLNEYEEMKRKTAEVVRDKPLVTVPSSLCGSESSLLTCLPLNNARNHVAGSAEDASTSAFLRNWEAEKSNTVLSDEDSDANHSGMFTEKTINNIDVSQCQNNTVVSDFVEIVDNESIAFGQEACDDSVIKLSGDIVIESNQQCSDVCRVDLQNTVSDTAQDALLENVTNRTEALASHSSSFNMFRSRFRGALGSS